MFPEERQQRIYALVCERRSIRVSELSCLLEISEVTVRRDLEELHNQKKILRTHGGAIAMYSVANEISATELIFSNKCVEEKRAIAARAYAFINDGDTILTDSSSTVYELIKLIAANDEKNLRIITTSLYMVNMLSGCEHVKVILTGGEVNNRHNNVEGHITKQIIRSLRADKALIGINGIDENFGYSTPRFEDAETKTEMMRSAIQSFILADNTKFEKTYLAKISAECDYLITDTRLKDYGYEWLSEITDLVFADEKQ